MILKNDRPLEDAYEFSKERLSGLSLEAFKVAFKDWHINGFYQRDKIAGVVFIKTGFVHICVNPEYRKRWATKGLIKSILDKASFCGKVYTSVNRGDDFRQDFARRLGFRKMLETGDIEIYEADHEIQRS